MKRVTISLPSKQLEELEILAHQAGVSLAEAARQALDHGLGLAAKRAADPIPPDELRGLLLAAVRAASAAAGLAQQVGMSGVKPADPEAWIKGAATLTDKKFTGILSNFGIEIE